MNTAYLIATIDITTDPPSISGVSIIGESWQTATLPHTTKRCYTNLWHSNGTDWEDALANLRTEVGQYPGLRWALAWVDAARGDPVP